MKVNSNLSTLGSFRRRKAPTSAACLISACHTQTEQQLLPSKFPQRICHTFENNGYLSWDMMQLICLYGKTVFKKSFSMFAFS
jgi:hypothetical protein